MDDGIIPQHRELPASRLRPDSAASYADYLQLDTLLGAQCPMSDVDDELLFIITHQTKELWLKQIIRELRTAKPLVRAGNLEEAYKALTRISRIQVLMTQSWDVLATITPTDYSKFRGKLGSSSGFQSDQFRIVEYMLGLKDGSHLQHQVDRPEAHAEMESALTAPSLWDDANAALAAAGFSIPDSALRRDWACAYQPDGAVEAAWARVYRDTHRWWDFYQLAEKLVDVDDALATWRHKHVLTVSRVIGSKPGTGGTAGVAYLQNTLSKRAFPELWSLRTAL